MCEVIGAAVGRRRVMFAASALAFAPPRAAPLLDLRLQADGNFDILVGGKPWLSGGDVRLGPDSSADGGLVLAGGPTETTGPDLGGWNATTYTWALKSQHPPGPVMTTTFRSFQRRTARWYSSRGFPAAFPCWSRSATRQARARARSSRPLPAAAARTTPPVLRVPRRLPAAEGVHRRRLRADAPGRRAARHLRQCRPVEPAADDDLLAALDAEGAARGVGAGLVWRRRQGDGGRGAQGLDAVVDPLGDARRQRRLPGMGRPRARAARREDGARRPVPRRHPLDDRLLDGQRRLLPLLDGHRLDEVPERQLHLQPELRGGAAEGEGEPRRRGGPLRPLAIRLVVLSQRTRRWGRAAAAAA